MKLGKVHIGTSGWSYDHWNGIFYPEQLKPNKRLNFYSSNYSTTEINNSFYHLPTVKSFKNWHDTTPNNFVFSVKVSRYISHIKRLNGVKEPWTLFLKRVKFLKKKRGPILNQFPSSFQKNEQNFTRLSKFLSFASKNNMLAIEFRNPTWLSDETFKLLKKFNTSLVMADSAIYPIPNQITADFIYIRMHGPGRLFSSRYSIRDIKKLAKKIRSWQDNGYDVFVYFNNDYAGYAIANAKELHDSLKNLRQ